MRVAVVLVPAGRDGVQRHFEIGDQIVEDRGRLKAFGRGAGADVWTIVSIVEAMAETPGKP